jgi:GntR family transcriptional regulator
MSPTPRRAAAHAIPRYLEIERALRSEIAHLRPGDPLPSDADLCDRFGVSRMTARQGVQRLADVGLVYRVPGQGTFVADQPVHRRAGILRSFSEDMRTRGLSPHSRLLDTEQRLPEPVEKNALQLADGERVIAIRRLRLADDVPMAVELSVLSQHAAAVLDEDLEAGSLHEALTRVGRAPALARGHLEPQAASMSDAELLEIDAGRPLLVERRTVFDAQDRPIEMTETRYSPSRYVFDVELRSDGY